MCTPHYANYTTNRKRRQKARYAFPNNIEVSTPSGAQIRPNLGFCTKNKFHFTFPPVFFFCCFPGDLLCQHWEKGQLESNPKRFPSLTDSPFSPLLGPSFARASLMCPAKQDLSRSYPILLSAVCPGSAASAALRTPQQRSARRPRKRKRENAASAASAKDGWRRN